MIPLIIRKIVQIKMQQFMTVCMMRQGLYFPLKIASYQQRFKKCERSTEQKAPRLRFREQSLPERESFRP